MSNDKNFAVIDETNTVITFLMCDDDSEDSKNVALESSNGSFLVESPAENMVHIGAHYHNGAFFHPSWIFDEVLDSFVAPVPYPTDGRLYRWVENSDWQGWDPLTPYPSWIFNEEENVAYSPVPYPADDKEYTWDEATTSWVEIQ
jgi:hypothetical protein